MWVPFLRSFPGNEAHQLFSGAHNGGFWVWGQKVNVEKVYVLFPSLSHLSQKLRKGVGGPRIVSPFSRVFLNPWFGEPVVCTLDSRGFRHCRGFRDFRESSTRLLVCSCLNCLRRFRRFRDFRRFSMPNMTGRPGYWTVEMNGGSSAPYLACTPCVPLFVHSLIRVEAEGLLD